MENFRSIDELIRMLSREKVLLKDMFQNRKKLSYRYDTARELVEYKESRIAFLIDHGVIHDGGDFLELAGISIFLTEFRKPLDDPQGKRTEFFIPFDASERIARGSSARIPLPALDAARSVRPSGSQLAS